MWYEIDAYTKRQWYSAKACLEQAVYLMRHVQPANGPIIIASNSLRDENVALQHATNDPKC